MWKVFFFIALALWAVTLSFVLWNHHDALNSGVKWSNEHLFARATPNAGMAVLRNVIKRRPVLDPELLKGPLTRRADNGGSAAFTTTTAPQQPGAVAGGLIANRNKHSHHHHAAAEERQQQRAHEVAERKPHKPQRPKAVRTVAISGCHHVLGGCSACLERFDGRSDFEGEDCVPVVPASIVDNTCEPRRWVEENDLKVVEDCDTSSSSSSSSSSKRAVGGRGGVAAAVASSAHSSASDGDGA